MASVFCDSEGILFIDYLEKGKTITGEYYSNLLTRLDEKIRKKKPGLQKKIILHQGNAPAHKSDLAMGKLRDLHYELLEHPPYSPDSAPLTSVSSQNSNSSSLVSYFLRIKRRLQM
jgi:transposase